MENAEEYDILTEKDPKRLVKKSLDREKQHFIIETRNEYPLFNEGGNSRMAGVIIYSEGNVLETCVPVNAKIRGLIDGRPCISPEQAKKFLDAKCVMEKVRNSVIRLVQDGGLRPGSQIPELVEEANKELSPEGMKDRVKSHNHWVAIHYPGKPLFRFFLEQDDEGNYGIRQEG